MRQIIATKSFDGLLEDGVNPPPAMVECELTIFIGWCLEILAYSVRAVVFLPPCRNDSINSVYCVSYNRRRLIDRLAGTVLIAVSLVLMMLLGAVPRFICFCCVTN